LKQQTYDVATAAAVSNCAATFARLYRCVHGLHKNVRRQCVRRFILPHGMMAFRSHSEQDTVTISEWLISSDSCHTYTNRI